MSYSRIYAVFLRQWYLIKSSPVRIASTFLWILISVVQWGFLSKYLDSIGNSTFSFLTVLLGAVVFWEFMERVQQGVMMGFLEDVWTQNFINFFASPLKIGEYLAGLVLWGVATSVVGFLAIAVVVGLAFGFNVFLIGLVIIPFMTILLVFGMAIGFLIAAMVFRFGPSAEWLSWPIPIVLSIISGVFYPVSALPSWLRMLAYAFPSTYVFEGLRGIVLGTLDAPALASHLAIGALLAAAYVAATYLLFNHVYRYNLKSGGIARFSAES